MTALLQIDTSLPNEWVAHLLALPTQAGQLAQLHSQHSLNQASLTQLLDHVEQLTQQNPGQARQLAALCEAAAEPAAAPTIVPRALYLRAQSHAINGELDLALTLVEAAHQGFLQLGLEVEALRTHIGRMRVLSELGRFQAALAAGQQVVEWVDRRAVQATAEQRSTELQALLALAKTEQGIAYDHLGRFQEALVAFDTAETLYDQLEMTVQSAAVKNNRGLALLYMGRVSDALLAFDAARQIQAAEGLTLAHAHTQSNLGEAYLLLGNYRQALAAFEEAHLLLSAQDALTDQQINLRQMADAYLSLNLFVEALATYREVEQQFALAGMVHERAWALWGMGAALAGQGQLAAATVALAEAATLFASVENVPLLVGVRLEEAALLDRQGDRQGAFRLAQQALVHVTTGNWPIQHFFARLCVADLSLPDLAAAEDHLLAAQQLSATLALPHLQYRLDQRLGRLRLLQQRPLEAAAILERAVTAIEGLRSTLPVEPMRIAFLHDKLAVYEMLVQLYLERGDAESIQRAFRMAEQARSRTLLERMAGLLEAQHTTSEPEPDQRLQALQADLNAIYSHLLNQESSQTAESGAERSLYSATLQSRAVLLEQEISRLRLLVSPTITTDLLTMPLSLSALQQQLVGQVLIVYYLLGDEIIAFIATHTQLQVVRHLSTRPVIETLLYRLRSQWERFRAGRSFIQRHLGRLEQSTARIMQELYEALFAPVNVQLTTLGLTESAHATEPLQLTIVPHGLLHGVPFQALFDGSHTLLDRYTITYAPSAAALALLHQRPAAPPLPGLIMGVADPGIPAIRQEVANVAAHLPAAAVHLNDQATIQRLLATAPMASVLHLACHAIFRADNPMFSALKLTDGWLTAMEVAQLRLRCALVVLSACESGRGQSLGGDEILGLARAFLGAGATTLVVSQWMVQDEATATLMAHFYANLATGQPVAAALRAAQLTLKTTLAHPYYWAPFILMGDPAMHLGELPNTSAIR
jgi:CHAT domain-containing protein